MFYIITVVTIIIGLLTGFYFTLRTNKKIEREKKHN